MAGEVERVEVGIEIYRCRRSRGCEEELVDVLCFIPCFAGDGEESWGRGRGGEGVACVDYGEDAGCACCLPDLEAELGSEEREEVE